MSHDQSKIDDAVLALLAALSFEEGRAWKAFDFEVMTRLFEQGLIEDPRGKTKSIDLTPEGLRRGRELADLLFR
jgi:hypothetical protein